MYYTIEYIQKEPKTSQEAALNLKFYRGSAADIAQILKSKPWTYEVKNEHKQSLVSKRSGLKFIEVTPNIRIPNCIMTSLV